jgi:peptidoglycan hydrolase CwlO-like protein
VEENKKSYEGLVEEHETQVRNWRQDDKAELGEIDAEKQEFIESQVSALDGIIGEINNNNGVLTCKNNNLEKEITDLRRKMEEHRYLLYRLENNTTKLR